MSRNRSAVVRGAAARPYRAVAADRGEQDHREQDHGAGQVTSLGTGENPSPQGPAADLARRRARALAGPARAGRAAVPAEATCFNGPDGAVLVRVTPPRPTGKTFDRYWRVRPARSTGLASTTAASWEEARTKAEMLRDQAVADVGGKP